MIIHVPVIGGRLVPNVVKIGLGLLLTIALVPWQVDMREAPDLSTFSLAMAIGQELLIGTLAGFGAALTFGALQIAGDIIGQGGGFGAARALNPISGSTDSVTNQFFVLTATLLFLVSNSHHAFLIAVQRTFDFIPLNNIIPEFSVEPLISLTGTLFAIGIQLALPVLGTVMLTDLTLGLLARVAPQVHVFFLGMPLKVGITLIVLGIALGLLYPLIAGLFQSLGGRTLELLGA